MHLVALWRRWHTLTECVRKGTSVTYTEMKDRDPKWTEAFIAAMHKNAQFRAKPVVATLGAERFQRVLDVGGGSGAYSIAFAQANPKLHATILDLDPVTEIAQRHIAAAGLADRVTTRVGDLNKDALGDGYDLVFLSAIYHMNSEDQNRDLTQRAMQALAPGGMIAVQDFILNADKSGPFTGALFSLNMLVATPEGASYSVTEYTEWLRKAGFIDIRHIPLAGPTGLIVGRRPESK
jgi:predicted O-methyltransferase YrrM